MKRVFIIVIILVALVGLFFISKSLFFKSKRHRTNEAEKTSLTTDIVNDSTNIDNTGTAQKNDANTPLIGKWERTKEITPQGVVKLDKDCNTINYKVVLSADNTFTMEFDRTDNPSSGAHKTKTGTWKNEKINDLNYISNLILTINKNAGGTIEKMNKIKVLNDTALVLVDPENNTQFFKKKK